MTRKLITALALVALAFAGCGEKGGTESKTEKKATKSKTKEPSPLKAPAIEAPAAANTESESEPEAKLIGENRGVDAPPTGEGGGVGPEDPPTGEGNRGVDAPPTGEGKGVGPEDPPTGEPEVPVAEVPQTDLAPLDLSTIDSTVKVIIMAPGGAAARDDYGSIEIASEPDFQMEFSEEDAVDFLARKKEIEANSINRLKKYHVDTADTLIYETEIMGKPEFHFIATVSVADVLYLCEDQKGPVFSQAAVATMLASCRSARLKEHGLPMPALDGKPGPTMPPIDLD